VRVLFLSEFFRPFVGGIEVLAAKLLPALDQRGYEFLVVTSHGPMELADEDRLGDIRVLRYPFRPAFTAKAIDQIIELRRSLLTVARDYDPDVIHLNGASPLLLFTLPLLAATRAPVLLQLHLELLGSQTDGTDTLLERVLRRADWVTSVSAAALAQARSLLPDLAGRSSVLPNAVDPPPLPPTDLPLEPPCILCLGRVTHQKGFDLAVRAFAALAAQFPGLRMRVAGDGDQRPELEDLAAALGVAERVEFTGWIPPDRVPALINEATVVLMPSRHEGMPLVAIQAAWMSRPVVATRVGGLHEVVRHGETGLLVDAEDLGGLTDALAWLLKRPHGAVRMGAAARALMQQSFGWDACVDAYDALYQQLAAGSSLQRLRVVPV
jgi:glycogen(starch) synthase